MTDIAPSLDDVSMLSICDLKLRCLQNKEILMYTSNFDNPNA